MCMTHPEQRHDLPLVGIHAEKPVLLRGTVWVCKPQPVDHLYHIHAEVLVKQLWHSKGVAICTSVRE